MPKHDHTIGIYHGQTTHLLINSDWKENRNKWGGYQDSDVILFNYCPYCGEKLIGEL